MKVFVTGADGFIGSHLCEALRERGDEVTGLALYNSFDSFGWLDEVHGVKRVRGDIRDTHQMRALIRGHDIVFHLAALISVPYSYEAPLSFVDTNITGTLNILQAAMDTGARVVHTSTSEVYGSVPKGAITEQHPMQPQSLYAASRVAGDALVRAYHLSYGLPAVILRPFNTYGPRQSQRAVVAGITSQALNGDTIKLGNQSAMRDLMHVEDTVAAFLAVSKLTKFDTYNAGTGESVTIRSLALQIALAAGAKGKIVDDKARYRPVESEVTHLRADASKLMKETNWKPKISLEAGIKQTIAWHRERGTKEVGHIT